MQLNFYYYPFSCATATHIILEASELTYRRHLIDLANNGQQDPSFLEINRKGSVPALMIDDQLLTENQAILTWVADQVPEKQLIPPVGDFRRYRAHELMNYCAASLHTYVRGVFRASAYCGNDHNACDEVRQYCQLNVSQACLYIESILTSEKWSISDNFSTVDAYLFIMYIWSRDPRMGPLPDTPKWHELAVRVSKLEATKVVLKKELTQRPTIDISFLS